MEEKIGRHDSIYDRIQQLNKEIAKERDSTKRHGPKGRGASEKPGSHQKANDLLREFEAQLGQGEDIGISDQTLVDLADCLGQYLSSEIKTNKIRRFLDALRKIENETEYQPGEVALIRPKLAYTVGRSSRHESPYMLALLKFLDPMLVKASAEDLDGRIAKANFRKVLKFFESIMAYHKFYGGAD